LRPSSSFDMTSTGVISPNTIVMAGIRKLLEMLADAQWD
jgi:hypothetical protein